MAFVRFSGPGGPHPYVSDVYILADTRGGYTCSGCRLHGGHEARFEKFDEIDWHLIEHQEAGDVIPVWMWFQAAADPNARAWDDTTIAEMVAIAREKGGKILSWDADIPADLIHDMTELEEMLQKAKSEQVPETIRQEFTSGMSPPTGSEESSTSRLTET